MLFDREAIIYGGEWLFETVEIEDDRFPSKEYIVGFRDDENNKQLAFTPSYI